MYKEIEPTGWPCHKEKGAALIGTGIDSNVYKVGDLVVKNYKLQIEDGILTVLNLDILNNYFQATNLASKFLEGHTMALESTSNRKRYPIAVNPFLGMHKCAVCGGVEGICKFIPGQNLENAYMRLKLFDLPDELTNLSFKLGDELGVYGIRIIPTNVKVTNENLIVITDLCADIDNLSRIPV